MEDEWRAMFQELNNKKNFLQISSPTRQDAIDWMWRLMETKYLIHRGFVR